MSEGWNWGRWCSWGCWCGRGWWSRCLWSSRGVRWSRSIWAQLRFRVGNRRWVVRLIGLAAAPFRHEWLDFPSQKSSIFYTNKKLTYRYPQVSLSLLIRFLWRSNTHLRTSYGVFTAFHRFAACHESRERNLRSFIGEKKDRFLFHSGNHSEIFTYRCDINPPLDSVSIAES
jgi:hypothetical protein